MNNLKNLRINKNYTVAQLAALLGVGESVVCMWEKDVKKPDLTHFLMLCRLLSCKPIDLFADSENTDTICKNLVPVLGKDKIVLTQAPENLYGFAIDFAVSLNKDVSGRFNKDDICFFTFDCKDIHNGDLVLIYDNNSCDFVIFDRYITISNVIAVCKFLKQRL